MIAIKRIVPTIISVCAFNLALHANAETRTQVSVNVAQGYWSVLRFESDGAPAKITSCTGDWGYDFELISESTAIKLMPGSLIETETAVICNVRQIMVYIKPIHVSDELIDQKVVKL
jgi:hypothetical protein